MAPDAQPQTQTSLAEFWDTEWGLKQSWVENSSEGQTIHERQFTVTPGQSQQGLPATELLADHEGIAVRRW